PLQPPEPRRAEHEHRLEQLRPHHEHADPRPGRAAHGPAQPPLLVLSGLGAGPARPGPPPPMDDLARLRRWRTATAGTLLLGYAGYYVCRSNLSVAAPLLLADPSTGLDKATLGAIVSAGVLAYAIGKVANGVVADFLGGRAAFLGGMVLSIGATLWFGAG